MYICPVVFTWNPSLDWIFCCPSLSVQENHQELMENWSPPSGWTQTCDWFMPRCQREWLLLFYINLGKRTEKQAPGRLTVSTIRASLHSPEHSWLHVDNRRTLSQHEMRQSPNIQSPSAQMIVDKVSCTDLWSAAGGKINRRKTMFTVNGLWRRSRRHSSEQAKHIG